MRRRASAQDTAVEIVDASNASSAQAAEVAKALNNVSNTGKVDSATKDANALLAGYFNIVDFDTMISYIGNDGDEARMLAANQLQQKKLRFLVSVLSKEASNNPDIRFNANSFKPPFPAKKGDIELHNLNLIVKNENVIDKLLCPAGKLLKTATLSPEETTRFPSYFSKRYSSIKELFNFFQDNLEQDLANKEKKIETNGISFKTDLKILDKTLNSLKQALRNFDRDIADYIEDSDLVDNRFQLSIVRKRRGEFLGVYLFFAGPKLADSQSNSLLRVWVDKKHFLANKNNNPFVDANCQNYLQNLTKIADLGNEDLARAKNLMNCSVSLESAPAGFGYDASLDYLNFSATYHKPIPILNQEMSKTEFSKWRAAAATHVGATGALLTNARDGIDESLSSLAATVYVVSPGDVLVPYTTGEKKYPFGSVTSADGTKKPSKLAAALANIRTENGVSPKQQILNMNGWGGGLLPRDEDKISLWTRRAKEKGNSLVVGEKIRIPRPTFDPATKAKDMFKVDFSAQGELTEEQLLKVWEEEIVSKLISKLCPSELYSQIAECLLPTNCREMIEFIGLWRIRELLDNMVVLDTFTFDDRNGLEEALKQWDRLVESSYNFKAIHFRGEGVLSSGQFDATPVYSGDNLSLSMQVRFDSEDDEINGNRTKYLMSVGTATSGGTFNGNGFAIKRDNKGGKIQFDLYSASENKKMSFTILDDFFNDNKWHQLGFTWAGGAGNFEAYVDGRKVRSEKTTSSTFVGALASPSNARVVIASENHKNQKKSVSAYIDEVCLFGEVLSTQQWEKLGDIDSDVNLNTTGLSHAAIAWWRMGDAFNDTSDKIVDMVGSITLQSPPNLGAEQDVIVARLFKKKDEPRFIDLLSRESNIIRVCDKIYEFMKTGITTLEPLDPSALKEAILEKFRFPDFQKDPHSTIKVVIKDALVLNLIRMMARFLMAMLEKIMDCQNWKQMLAGTIKASATGFGEGSAFEEVFRDSIQGTPVGDFVEACHDPSKWEELLSQDFAAVQTAYENMLNTTYDVQIGDGNPVTLGLGTVQFTEAVTEERSLTHGAFDLGDSTVVIKDSASDTHQNTIINIAKKATESLTSAEAMGLFSSTPEQQALSKLTDILNSSSSESGNVYSENEVAQITGRVGSFLGLQGAIDQLQYASQVLKDKAPLPEGFCTTSQDNSDRLGFPKTNSDKEKDKAALQELMQQALDIESESTAKKKCAVVIPLSDSEKSSLERTISDVFSPIVSSFNNDMTLYKMARTSSKVVNKEVLKVWWKGEKYTKKVWNDETQKLEPETFLCEETQMNPEFEAMVEQGFIPYKKGGKKVDGTKYGGVVKTEWLPFQETPWLSEKRPPESLVAVPPDTEDGDVEQPDIEIGDLHKSLGPYTDYSKGNEYAIASYPKTRLSGKMASSLSDSMKDAFMSSAGAGEDSSAQGAGYFSDRLDKFSTRGIENVETETRTSLVPSAAPKSGRQKNVLKERVKNSLSEMSHTIAYGRSLQGEKVVSFETRGADGNVDFAFPEGVAIPFSLSTETKEALNAFGYEEPSEDCEPTTSEAMSTNSQRNVVEKYIPQEYAFEDVVQSNFRTGIPSSVLKKDVYNSLYSEVLTALLYKTAASPLLKAVPNLSDADGEPLLAINFLNLDTDPNLLDMQTFSSQVSEDYSLLLACPDGLIEPPLYSAIKIGMPRILARLCIIELATKAIIPFTQLFFSRKDPVIKEFILEKLFRDIQLYSSDEDVFMAKVISQYNKLAERGDIDEPEIELAESGAQDMRTPFRTAMSYFIEDEFDFIANRLKETVHGECIPESPESENDIKKGMYAAIFEYAELGNKNIKTEYYAMLKETDTQEQTRVTDFDIRTQFKDIESIGASLVYEYEGKTVVLSEVEQSMEDFLTETELDLDDDSLECDTSSIYGTSGMTTESSNHRHEYVIDENGNGTAIAADGHQHAIYNYAVVPHTSPGGEVRHSHTLVPKTTQAAIEESFVETRALNHMKNKLMETDSFKVMFDFCFNLNDVASFILAYCLVTVDDQIMSKSFSSTKKAIINMFGWLWKEDSTTDACETKEAARAKGVGFEDMFPELADMYLNPEFLLMMLLAPLNTYKGWAKIADPHVFITSTIMDLLKFPVIPKNVKKNIPDIDNPGKIKCADMPDFSQAISVSDMLFGGMEDMWTPSGPVDVPPTYLAAPLIETGVQLGVTFAPCIVGSPPYPATPYGYVYYFAVSPLIWALKDLPRILDNINKNSKQGKLSDFEKNLMSIGLMQPAALACFDNEPTEDEEVAANAATAAEDEGCPPVRDFTKTIIEAGGSADPADADC
tara:strand:- start:6004 stop:12939 length:6936 start_codon:yes stop_codon:yes gene_type:complete